MIHTPVTAAASEEDRELDDAVERAMEDWLKLVELRHALQHKPPRNVAQLGQARAYQDELEANLKSCADRALITVAALERYCQVNLDRKRRQSAGHRVEQRRISEDVTRGERLAEAIRVDEQALVHVDRQRDVLRRRIAHNLAELKAYNAGRLG